MAVAKNNERLFVSFLLIRKEGGGDERKARQDKTRQNKTRQDRTRQEKARQKKERQTKNRTR